MNISHMTYDKPISTTNKSIELHIKELKINTKLYYSLLPLC